MYEMRIVVPNHHNKSHKMRIFVLFSICFSKVTAKCAKQLSAFDIYHCQHCILNVLFSFFVMDDVLGITAMLATQRLFLQWLLFGKVLLGEKVIQVYQTRDVNWTKILSDMSLKRGQVGKDMILLSFNVCSKFLRCYIASCSLVYFLCCN